MHEREPGDGSVRVVAQFLEGGAASAAISPGAAVACLRRAASLVPLSDLCLGWNLPKALVEAVADEARRLGQRVWLWHPLLSGDGDFVPRADAAVGPAGQAVPWPREMPEFAFDCPVRRSGMDAALERLDSAVDRGPWDGVLLDKIRWPSPTRDPAADLACFCSACQRAARSAGIDLAAVAARLGLGAGPGHDRLELLHALLGIVEDEPLASFMTWRTERITDAVTEAMRLVTSRSGPTGTPMRVALDVFAPSLAGLVGQDIAALSSAAELSKSMLYLGTHGPAGLPYELCGLTTWLAAGDVDDPAGRLSEALGYPLPSQRSICRDMLAPEVFATELERLRQAAGAAAAAGIDAIELADLAVLGDATLGTVARIAASSGVAIVLSWDLWAIPPRRLAVVAEGVEGTLAAGAAS